MEKSCKEIITSLQSQIDAVSIQISDVENKVSELLALQENLHKKKKTLLMQIEKVIQHEEQNVTQTAWDSDDFDWSENVKSTLKNKFLVENFRPLQKETINVTLSEYDCILIMPTGGGKSLCFQLPAVIMNGFTLVISPLISLMEDQLIALKNLGIEAIALSTSVPPKEVTSIMNQLISKDCPYKLVYVTPERIAKSKRFMAKLEKAYTMHNISRIVIDEVHCASHWGHDFRPDYKILGILKRQFPKVPIMGLTATASEKVLNDVKDMLNLDSSCVIFRASFNRANLYYEVHHTSLPSSQLISEIATTIKTRFDSKSGIVYCFSRKDCEDVAEGLLKTGISAHCYHADLQPTLKSKVHQKWTTGNLQVIVATIAFGMGIDKANVRFVIHFSISKSMENYYQESGRAGRDDEQAWCILYFRFQDIFRQSSMVFTEKTGLQNLYSMLEYCTNSNTCRRSLIGKHFAERCNSNKCKQMCDNCTRNHDECRSFNLMEDAKTLISILQKAKNHEERITPLKLIELWMGRGLTKLRPSQTTSYDKETCELVITKLLLEQVVTEDYHFTPYNTITYLLPGNRWKHLLNNEIDVHLIVPTNSKQFKSNEKKRFSNHNSDCIDTKKKKPKLVIVEDWDSN